MAEDVETWNLPVLEGFEVSDIWFSGRLHVIACGKWDQAAPPAKSAPRSQFAFGGPFTFEDKFGAHRNLSAEAPWETLTSVLELRHTNH